MTDKATDIIEKIARALCVTDGYDPDEIIEVDKPTKDGRLVLITANEPRWYGYKYTAKHHLAAFRVIIEAVKFDKD